MVEALQEAMTVITYIGLNENGRIVVDDYATFRVQMDDRGDNALNPQN